jgi:signal transduction histidine kinase
MLRRLLPTLIILIAGFLALVWGLVSLQRIFSTERDQARLKVASHRDALEQYAGQVLQEMLNARLDRAEKDIKRALKDPLVPSEGLILRVMGDWRLPRPRQYRPGTDTAARKLFENLRRGARISVDESDSPWARRLALFRLFEQALKAKDQQAVVSFFRRYLSHRATFVISSRKDIPCTLALLDSFSRKSSPAGSTMRRLLRDGLGYGRDRRMEGMQRLLLSKRNKFTRPDFEFLSRVVIRLCQAHRVVYEDFKTEALGKPPTLPRLPSTPTGPGLLDRGRYYVRPYGPDRVQGTAIDLAGVLKKITGQMKTRGLIGKTDAVHVDSSLPSFAAFRNVKIEVRSKTWQRDLRRIQNRYQLKTGLSILCGVLALIIVVLAAVFQLRKQRYLQMKSDFLSTVSHELRTPLASIRLLAETLELRTRDNTELAEYPQRILQDVDGLSFLVENILSFNRLDKGRWTPRFDSVRLDEVLMSVEKDLKQITTRPLMFSTEGTADITLKADEELIRLLFSNLGRNGAAYNARDPIEIRVSAARRGSNVVIRFTDNGVGIDKNDQEKVFEEFYRSSDRTGKAVRGSGLGLSICREIMRMHGGSISVAESGSEGTVFKLEFPWSD